MKIESILNKIIVYVYSDELLKCDIKDTIKRIIGSLKKYYKLDILGSYNIKLFMNNKYGYIIEIIKNDNYIKENIIKINLNILKDSLILYEVEDPLDYINNEIYYYDNKFYINLVEKDVNIMENSNLIYSNSAYKIIGRGIKIN